MSEAVIRSNRTALRVAVDNLLAAVDDDERKSSDATRDALVAAANDLAVAATAVQSAYRIRTEKRSAD